MGPATEDGEEDDGGTRQRPQRALLLRSGPCSPCLWPSSPNLLLPFPPPSPPSPSRPEQWNKLEAKVVNATGPKLCLDPSPDVFVAERHLHYEQRKARLVGRPSSRFSKAWLKGMILLPCAFSRVLRSCSTLRSCPSVAPWQCPGCLKKRRKLPGETFLGLWPAF